MSTTLSSSEADAAPMTPRAAATLIVLCGAIFLEGIDVAMLNIALPAIRADLNLTTTTLSGVVSAYVLGYAGFMLLGGRAADIFGKRRVFLSALVVFIAFSGLGGLATEGWMLLLARFVTGAASAFMTPAGLALVATNFPEGPQRNRAVTIYASTASAGFSLGLVLGGLLAAIDWRWVFFAPVILALLIFVAAIRLIADRQSRTTRERFDIPGAVALTAAMLLAVHGVTRLEHPDQNLAWTLAIFGVSAALWLAFFLIERLSAAPLVRFGIFRSGSLVRSNLGALLFAGSFFGFQFIATLYLQELLGWTPIKTSIAMLVIGIDAVVAPMLTPRLVDRFGNDRVIFAGFVLAAISYALLLGMELDWTYAAIFPSMLLLGLAFSIAYSPLTIAATDGIHEDEQGLAGGLVNTAFQFGAALGLSGSSAIGAYVLGEATSAEARLASLQMALIVPVAAAVAGALITAIGIRRCRDLACDQVMSS
ncbi:Major Facilitator Superfamily protein [Rhizobium mongolense subsp. loessense]|uniref:Major Facilitator Superfamily protein n=1 Tax=Rhizobium mongolense subsp. loessense TaxID=158890 RepID=A0A1G4SD46_9HYPH|nr:MFS transporter [Rhizobium mongolense]SCW67113.1 Major Facilitator Superfamily protein [Rhizobium mongolense subsp. loessense]